MGRDRGAIDTRRNDASMQSLLRSGLLLLGAFAFAFCLGEAVHEFGHFLVHRAYGVNVGIRLDPFGGSRILHGSSAPEQIWGITSVGGPLLNLVFGTILTLFLWRIRKPILLPFLLSGPVALIQEGVTFSLGMLTPGGDADLIVRWGVPVTVLITFGVAFLVSGIMLVCRLLPLVNLSSSDSFLRKFFVVGFGMVSFMALRLLGSFVLVSTPILENTVPLVFSILLATIVVVIYRPLYRVLNTKSYEGSYAINGSAVLLSSALGLGIILFQLVAF